MESGPIIVTALFEPAEQRWLDDLRRLHYPVARNQVPAHLTLFHHLPPGLEDELDRRLRAQCHASHPPEAVIEGPIKLGNGVALRIVSADLEDIRARIADAFAPMLIPQDAASWRPHVTIQNKVQPGVATALHARLMEEFSRRAIRLPGLATWRYRGGPWEPMARYSFSRSGRPRRN